MAHKLSAFDKLEGFTSVYTARNNKLRCSAIALPGGSVCLFSPVSGLNAEAKQNLEEMGDVTYLLAPNHYHNKGLVEYAGEFPNARVMASEDAIPRLHQITKLPVESVKPLLSLLPKQTTVLYPTGLKTGELWIRVKTKQGISWFVGDAFCTTKPNATQTIADSPELLGTFPKFGVADKTIYLDWVHRQIAKDKPTTIVPCHGQIVHAKDLTNKLYKLMEQFP